MATKVATKRVMEQEDVTTYRGWCPMCGARCAMRFHVQNGVLVGTSPDLEHPNGVPLCPKGVAAPELLYNSQRLQYPMRRTHPKSDPDPGWERISWDEALDTIATRLNQIKAEYGAEAVAFYRPAPGGSHAGDYNDFVTRFAAAFGSPNTGATTHICQWCRDHGSAYTYGVGLPWPDYKQTDCIVLWGHNPRNTWQTNYIAILEAIKRGAKLIVVDPRRIKLAEHADLWLQVRPGTDAALALGLIHVFLKEGLFDRGFATHWTTAPFLVRADTGRFLREADVQAAGDPACYVCWDTGEKRLATYDPATGLYESALAQPALDHALELTTAEGKAVSCKTAFRLLSELVEAYPPERVEEITWVPAANVREAARMIAAAQGACYFTYNGVEQHANTAQTNRALCILYALTGFFDAPGGNVIFPRPGAKSMAGQEFLSPETRRRRLGMEYKPLGAPSSGAIQGYDVYNAIQTGNPYPIKGFVSFGGNYTMCNGDSLRGLEALRQLEFYAHVDLFESPTSRLADVLLPASTFMEGWHVRTTFDQGLETCARIQLRPKIVEPLYESWPDLKIIFELAVRMGFGDRFWGGDLEAAFNDQLSPLGITVEDLRQRPEGISVPLELRYRKYQERDPQSGGKQGFKTPSKRIELYSETFLKEGYDPLPLYREPPFSPISRPDLAQRYPLILCNGKVWQYCHGQHRALPYLRRQMPHPTCEIHPETAASLGIADGEWVVVETWNGSVRVQAHLTEEVHPKTVFVQHGWWQACPELGLPGYDPYSSEGANANLLYTNEVIDPISGSVPHRSYLCAVRKAT